METLRDPVIMVPEIHIIDENPPIFDLEWMDQCVDKVSWILLDTITITR